MGTIRSANERKMALAKIIYRHTEILTKEEANKLAFWSSLIMASALFTIIVQLPLTIKYSILVRRDPVKNRHLLKWIYGMPAVAFPTFLLGQFKTDQYAIKMSQKYLSELSDFEIDNFESFYQ